jgi:hypothetical protein
MAGAGDGQLFLSQLASRRNAAPPCHTERYRGANGSKKGGTIVGQFKRAPVLLGPRFFDFDLVDGLLETTLGDDRDGQPFPARSRS